MNNFDQHTIKQKGETITTKKVTSIFLLFINLNISFVILKHISFIVAFTIILSHINTISGIKRT